MCIRDRDIAGWQYELRYERLDSPGALDATVRGLGVTHILSHPSKSLRYDSLGADLRFFDYITHHATALSPFGDLMLYSLPAAPVTASAKDVVAYLGCGNFYERGLHKLRSLSIRETMAQKPPPRRRALEKAPADAAGLAALIERADFVVTGDACNLTLPANMAESYVTIGTRNTEKMWSRRPNKPKSI
jgi:hypothetical protein